MLGNRKSEYVSYPGKSAALKGRMPTNPEGGSRKAGLPD
jgi:hypothetical protein